MTGPGQVALVTGGSRGIGAAVARRLAADGFAVAVNSHPDPGMQAAAADVAAGIRAAGGTAAVYPADISQAGDVDGLFRSCEAELGPVGALVLNAAVDARLPWTEITEPEWDTFMAVNLKGAFLCSRRAFGAAPPAPAPAAGTPARAGSIVTVSSVLAETGAASSLHYATTKAGLAGFTRSLARELGPAGIRVNCVMPGAIKTAAEEDLSGDPGPVIDARVLSRQVLPRRGHPDDIAAAVSFLVGPDSSFMTGQSICVDGGWLLR